MTARQLSDDLDDVDIDMNHNQITPVTLLKSVDKDYYNKTRKLIDNSYKKSIKALKFATNFNLEKFIEKFAIKC